MTPRVGRADSEIAAPEDTSRSVISAPAPVRNQASTVSGQTVAAIRGKWGGVVSVWTFSLFSAPLDSFPSADSQEKA